MKLKTKVAPRAVQTVLLHIPPDLFIRRHYFRLEMPRVPLHLACFTHSSMGSLFKIPARFGSIHINQIFPQRFTEKGMNPADIDVHIYYVVSRGTLRRLASKLPYLVKVGTRIPQLARFVMPHLSSFWFTPEIRHSSNLGNWRWRDFRTGGWAGRRTPEVS